MVAENSTKYVDNFIIVLICVYVILFTVRKAVGIVAGMSIACLSKLTFTRLLWRDIDSASNIKWDYYEGLQPLMPSSSLVG